MLSPAGQGAYAEQFVKLSALVERDAAGTLQACHDSLANRRPDPMILFVANPRSADAGQANSDLTERLTALVKTLAGRIEATQSVAVHSTSVASDDLGARH